MNFIKNILWYYERESQQGFFSSAFGALLLIAVIFLLKFASPLSLLKGFTIPFLLIGLVMGIGGFADGYSSRKSRPEKAQLFQKNPKEFFNKEVAKVEATHQSWKKVRLMWSIVSLIGLGLLFFVQKDYCIGVAVATLLLSAAGHIEEAISKRFNERYYYEVLDASKKENKVSHNSVPRNNKLFLNNESYIIAHSGKKIRYKKNNRCLKSLHKQDLMEPINSTTISGNGHPLSVENTSLADNEVLNQNTTSCVLEVNIELNKSCNAINRKRSRCWSGKWCMRDKF